MYKQFTVALLLITKIWKQPKFPSIATINHGASLGWNVKYNHGIISKTSCYMEKAKYRAVCKNTMCGSVFRLYLCMRTGIHDIIGNIKNQQQWQTGLKGKGRKGTSSCTLVDAFWVVFCFFVCFAKNTYYLFKNELLKFGGRGEYISTCKCLINWAIWV